MARAPSDSVSACRVVPLNSSQLVLQGLGTAFSCHWAALLNNSSISTKPSMLTFAFCEKEVPDSVSRSRRMTERYCSCGNLHENVHRTKDKARLQLMRPRPWRQFPASSMCSVPASPDIWHPFFCPLFHPLIQQYFTSQALPPAHNQQI